MCVRARQVPLLKYMCAAPSEHDLRRPLGQPCFLDVSNTTELDWERAEEEEEAAEAEGS